MEDSAIKTFETIMIFTEKFTEKRYNAGVDHYKNMLKELKAMRIKTEKMGKRKLAYETKKCNEGWYVLFTYEAPSELIHELERMFRIDDNVIKFLTVSRDEMDYEPDPDDPDQDQDTDECEQPDHSEAKPVDVFDLIFGITN